MNLESKDPNDIKDYVLSWATYLGADTILTSTWIMPAGITKDSDSYTTQATTIWLSGGTAGTNYLLTNRVTTAAGRTLDQTIKITVLER